jgi:ribosomal protein S18 acetylase RimI-like enzyme
MYKYSYTLPNDVSVIKKINEKYLPEHYKYTLWFDIIKSCPKYNFICKKDGVIVGYLLGTPNLFDGEDVWSSKKQNEILLMSIAVEEEHRKNGIAKNLIKLFLKSIGDKRCILQVRESSKAIKLYESLGFIRERIHQKYYEDGENAVMMSYQKTK